jgi:hypothetical protein
MQRNVLGQILPSQVGQARVSKLGGARFQFFSNARKRLERLRQKLEWPILLIIFLPFLIFGRSILPGRVFSAADNLFLCYPWRALEPNAVPQNPLFVDRTFVFEPWLIYASKQIHSARFPLWNVHAYAGAPFLGNIQSALLFPLTVLAYVIPVQTALGLIAILRIVTAGLSMYWLLEVFALEPLAATAGALAFMFSGCMIVWLGWPLTNVAIWLPLLIGLTERVRESGTWRYAGWLALIIGLQFLAGHPENSLFMLVLTACYAVSRVRGPALGRFLAQFAAAGALGGLLASVQLLPFFHYLGNSSDLFYRRHFASAFLMVLPFRAVVVLLIPNYFGNPTSGNFWGPSNYNEFSGFVGVLPWILTPCALLGVWHSRTTKFFTCTAILIGLVIYGAPPFPWLLSQLPMFSLSANHRMILLLAFSMAVLCGIGMQVLLKPPPDARLRILTGVKLVFMLLLVVVAAYLIADIKTICQQHLTVYIAAQCGAFVLLLTAGTFLCGYALRRGACSPRVAISLLTIELLSVVPFAYSYNPVIKSREFYPVTPALKYLQRDRSLFRVLLPVPNVGAVYGLSDITGYDGMTPRLLEQLVDVTGSVGPFGNGTLKFTQPLSSQITDLVNLKYILLPPAAPSPAPKFWLVYDGSDGRVYENSNVFPRAFLVSSALACLDDTSALALMRSGKVDLRRKVIIAGCPRLISGGALAGTLSLEHYGPQRITVHAEVQSPAFLVVTDSYDNGWHVWVDGHQAPILRADYAFRAVALGTGSHEVKFLYRPFTVVLGLAVSLVALLGTVVLIWWGRHPTDSR